MVGKLRSWARALTYGLARRLTIALSLFILSCAAIVLTISLFVQKAMIEERLALKAEHLSSLVKEVSIPSILTNDPAGLELFFHELQAREDVVSVALIDPGGMVWMAGDKDPRSFLAPAADPFLLEVMEKGEPQQKICENYLHRVAPITIAGRTIAYLDMRLPRAQIVRDLRSLWVSTGLIGLAWLVFGPFVAWLVSRRLSEPLMKLAGAARGVAKGDLTQRITSNSNDEFDLVAQSFNGMLDELQKSILETKRVAYEDKLTNVPNRSWLNLQIENLTIRQDDVQHFAILFIDVDKFKDVNDTHGHHIGDLLLRAFANRINRCMNNLNLSPAGVRIDKSKPLNIEGGEALFARLGGDEFTLILDHRVAPSLASAIVDVMDEAFQIEGLQLAVSSSIGIALCPDHATSREHLLKCADVAMYQAKEAGGCNFAIYDEHIHKRLAARTQMEKDLERAVNEDAFELFLQPKIDVATDEVTGAEALIRWEHPTKGRIPPDEFLPIAAGMGLMPKIGELMLEKAVYAGAQINRSSGCDISIAVNTASEELLNPKFAARLGLALGQAGLDPRHLEVEITEGTAMELSTLVDRNIGQLRDLGVKLAIDDFGIGYSNLGRLKTMAFDTLKVDRSLVVDIVKDISAQSLFRTILDMASILRADVVAEGVETEDQLAFLRDAGVKTYQGYYAARPMPAGEFRVWIEERRASKPITHSGERVRLAS
ncbi:MAG: EAL domain-containing protein [Pseudomonadota bacterium]